MAVGTDPGTGEAVGPRDGMPSMEGREGRPEGWWLAGAAVYSWPQGKPAFSELSLAGFARQPGQTDREENQSH